LIPKDNFLNWASRPSLTLLILCLLSQPAMGAKLDVVAKAALLMEMKTGKILFAKHPDLPRPPASTAKILTALVTLEGARLDEVVTARVPTSTSKTSIILYQAGDRLAVENLLHALLLQSSNEAALALASHVGGSTAKFVQLMNQKARSIGALRSRFLNPTGLPQSGQLTTARDLALITKAALAHSEFRKIVATRSYLWKSSKWEGVLENTNELLKSYDGAIGVKTGNTREAGHCLVAAARRGDATLIAVMLGSQEKQIWQDAQNLLDYGFKKAADSGQPSSLR
jgi:D-alanyl-D-alanine carboxypeptidase (penicillin-binding protein 5/6)